MKQDTALFLVLVGNIGSGKSTLTKALAKKDFLIMSRDAIRYMIGGGEYVFDTNLEQYVCNAHDMMLREFLISGKNIVVDEVNVQLPRRETLIEYANTMSDPEYYPTKYKTVAVVMPTLTKKESIDRRTKNNHGKNSKAIWSKVWDNFDKIYTYPRFTDGFDSVIKLYPDYKLSDLNKKLEFIKTLDTFSEFIV